MRTTPPTLLIAHTWPPSARPRAGPPSGKATVPVTSPLPGSMRAIPRGAASHSAPAATTPSLAPNDAWTVAPSQEQVRTGSPLAGSSRSSSMSLAAQTIPPPATRCRLATAPSGPQCSVAARRVTWLLVASIRHSVPAWFSAQTQRPSAAMLHNWNPPGTAIRAVTRPDRGSTRVTVSWLPEVSPLVTQTAPPPVATPPTLPIGILAVTRALAGSIRTTWPSSHNATHTPLASTASWRGPPPGLMGVLTAVGRVRLELVDVGAERWDGPGVRLRAVSRPATTSASTTSSVAAVTRPLRRGWRSIEPGFTSDGGIAAVVLSPSLGDS